MPTLLDCLHTLPPETRLRDRSAVRDQVASVTEHIARVKNDEADYEVRTHRFGARDYIAVGVIGGPDIYREEAA